jgi:hypothetical protein
MDQELLRPTTVTILFDLAVSKKITPKFFAYHPVILSIASHNEIVKT